MKVLLQTEGLYKCEVSVNVQPADMNPHEYNWDVNSRGNKENSTSRSRSYLWARKQQ